MRSHNYRKKRWTLRDCLGLVWGEQAGLEGAPSTRKDESCQSAAQEQKAAGFRVRDRCGTTATASGATASETGCPS